MGGIGGFALCFALGGNTVVLSSMSMELVATIFRITSGGGGAEGRGGGVFFFVRFLAPFSSDFE